MSKVKTVEGDFDEAERAWEEAKEASQKAREALVEAEELVRDARAHLQRTRDAERSAWVAMKDAQWVHTYGKDGKWLSSQLKPAGKRR